MRDTRALLDFMDEDEILINIPLYLMRPEDLIDMQKTMKKVSNEIGHVLFEGLMAAMAVGEFLYFFGRCTSRVGGEKGSRCTEQIGHEGPHRNTTARWT